ncbi:LLM class flavin-dependent oxidoreductase [Nocardia sp. 2]|uniref:LLM class flavin-dependent oxidoreductase n=2 Tax=Nocardia acididurans TaxID=2802282 RepID=A0ABS1MAR1_9NOCA|nr:LLM class flavin-dependent oxidoreductase [Nocardia acididurans]
MGDYGHELRFGIFVPPEAARERSLLRLIRLSDEIGLEVLAVQDHPYQPAFLDTWTLLSYVAATTRNITLLPAVANLPLRPPAVLARSVTTLDILSGGRIELGLGAGAFWDAIDAMGGEKRTPGQALRALREAITVIRALWGEGRPVVDGEFYRLRGAKAGPPPPRRVGIWLGVYGPKALRLAGELADGWLGGYTYAPPDMLSRLMNGIDTGAREAGRVPGLIRRAYVIDPSMTVQQLTEVALADGISEFLLPVAPDGEWETQRYAAETAPAVRAAVAAARV